MTTDLFPLSSKESNSIVLLYGEEKFIRDQYFDQLVGRLNKTYYDFNFDKLIADEITFKSIKEISETLPFFDNKRVLLLDDLDLSKNKIGEQKDLLDELQKYMPNIPKTTTIIIRSNDNVFRGKFYKSIEKYGQTMECKKLEYTDLIRFIRGYLSDNSIKLSNKMINQIIEYSHYLDGNMKINLYDLNHELNKIIEYSKNHKLTSEKIESMMTEHYETNIFKLLDAVSQRDLKKALKYYTDLIRGQGDPFQIFYMIIRQVRLILLIKEQKRKKKYGNIARKQLKISQFEYNKISKTTHNWKYKQCYHGVHQGFMTEVQLKSISIEPNILVEKYLCQLLK